MSQRLTTTIVPETLRHPWPARLLHWVYVPALFISALSGFYVSDPRRRRLGFRRVERALKFHHTAQYFFLFSVVARAYYAYTSRDYRMFIPTLKDLRDTPGYLAWLFFLKKKEPKFPKYNPAQKLVFTTMAVLFPLQIITGLGLYAPKTVRPPSKVVGGLSSLRKTHYLTAVAISSLATAHLYLALTESLRKLKSIFTGYE